MATCNVINGIDGICDRKNAQGIKIVYIGEIPSAATLTNITEYATIDETTEIISNLSGATSNIDLYKYVFAKDMATYVGTPTATAFGVFWDQVLTLDFAKMTAEKRLEIMALSYSQRLVCVMVDFNNNAWTMGLSAGASMTGGLEQLTTENKYQVVLSAKESTPAYNTSLAAITAAIV